jgi:ribA/ribD-fused uncharacterized protein
MIGVGISYNAFLLNAGLSRVIELFQFFWNNPPMKKLSTILILFILSYALFAAPHYEKYPRTEAVEYQEAVLDFYSVNAPYGEFSNFALFPIEIDGVIWATSEHYYQAHKYDDPALIEWVRSAPTPFEAAKRGRDKTIPKRVDWDELKDHFMTVAVREKIRAYPELALLLKLTGHARLFEHTKNDCYWGDCGDRTGKNKLGLLLEEIRTGL